VAVQTAEMLYTEAMKCLREGGDGRAYSILSKIKVDFHDSRWCEYATAELKKLAQNPALNVGLNSISLLRSKTAELETEWSANHRKLWEYKNCDDPDIDQLNALGNDGWELVSIAAFQQGGGLTINGIGGAKYVIHVRHVFKREIANSIEIRSMRSELLALEKVIFSD
jgi:hypothetical protein